MCWPTNISTYHYIIPRISATAVTSPPSSTISTFQNALLRQQHLSQALQLRCLALPRQRRAELRHAPRGLQPRAAGGRGGAEDALGLMVLIRTLQSFKRGMIDWALRSQENHIIPMNLLMTSVSCVSISLSQRPAEGRHQAAPSGKCGK